MVLKTGMIFIRLLSTCNYIDETTHASTLIPFHRLLRQNWYAGKTGQAVWITAEKEERRCTRTEKGFKFLFVLFCDQMLGDRFSPAMRSFRRSSFIAFRRSNLGNLYQSFTRRKKSTGTSNMADAHTTAAEVREKEQAPSFSLHTISTMTSLPDVEDDEAGPSSAELSPTPIPPVSSALQRTESNTSFLLRLSGRLRRSLHFPSNKREQSVKFLAGNEVAVKEDVKPPLLHESGEEAFTNHATIKIVNCDESYDEFKLIQQILRRNRPDEIKKLLRKRNWPLGHRVRANLWQEICKLNNPDFNAYKGSYESEAWEEHSGDFSPKVRFLLSSDTIYNCYELNANGLKALHRLIRALDATIPTLNYAPFVQPILALFLHYMNEDDAYACVFWILKNHANYMKSSAQASKATSYTLLALVKIHKPAVYKTLKNWIGSSDANILTRALQNWSRWIFCALPFEHLICVIDCYLYEGSKVLMRVAIALLSTWHKNVKIPDDLAGKTCQERIDLFAEGIVQSIKDENVSVAALFETATKIRNFSGSQIARFQERHEKMILQSEGPDFPTVDLPAMYIKPFISSIVSSEVAFQLMCYLPERYQLTTPVLIYRVCDDGTSFYHLWTKIDEAESTLLIIKTDKGEVFGAFCDEPWGNRTKIRERGSGKYFGGGLSFVWNLDENNQVNKYNWKENQAEYFMAAPYDREPTVLMIGGNAIYIADELIKGSTLPGNTFRNPELVKGGAFKIYDMEVI
uniref:Rab-GAP TBC domain-containing protein n=1 Tax=Elaeophora elaphi TaxID=1147741 RepID=A0A0R3RPM2_9BILA